MTKPEYHIGLSESGLLINIAVVYQDAYATGEVVIRITDWPRVRHAVEQSIAERRLVAQAENIVDRLNPDDECGK